MYIPKLELYHLYMFEPSGIFLIILKRMPAVCGCFTTIELHVPAGLKHGNGRERDTMLQTTVLSSASM